MKQIDDYDTLAPVLSAQLKKGVATNTTLTPDDYRAEIRRGTLLAHAWAGGLILLRRRTEYQILNYYLHPPFTLPELTFDRPTVVEIARRESAPEDSVARLWQSAGFIPQFTRERLALPANAQCPDGLGAVTVRESTAADQAAVDALLRRCFDPLLGCLSPPDALIRELTRGDYLCAVTPDGALAGILHISPGTGNSTQLRHLAVDARCRRQGAAQSLLHVYLTRTAPKRSQVWVRQDNPPARNFYRKNGYAPDGWISRVLLHP